MIPSIKKIYSALVISKIIIKEITDNFNRNKSYLDGVKAYK